MNFNFVTTRLATGGALDESGVEMILASGITHIIDCQAELDDSALLSGRFAEHYLWCPTADDGTKKTAEWFRPGIVFAMDAFFRPSAKVYCHCAMGRNRGP